MTVWDVRIRTVITNTVTVFFPARYIAGASVQVAPSATT